MPQLSTIEVWVVLLLFAASLSCMLWIAWQDVKVTPRYVLQFLTAFALTVLDAAALIYNSHTYIQ